jgi:curved DNA-binding protein CbpA
VSRGIVKTYYELLRVAPDASAAQIKQAFRQIIARYHPDKVQHLGAEFQELAQVRSAELTTAYKTLIDTDRRAEYDESLRGGFAQWQGTEPAAGRPVPQPPASPAAPPPSSSSAAPPPPAGDTDAGKSDASFETLRSGRDAVLRRAALARLDQLFDQAFPASERPAVPGFDLSCLSRPRLFDRARSRPWLLGKFVSKVDRQAMQQVWAQAARANATKKAAVSVFLLSGNIATEREIADVMAAHKRRVDPEQPIVIIPVDVRDWHAFIPSDADPSVRSLAARLGAR